MSISDLIKNYGLPAVAFHFSVWITCLATVYAVFSLSGDNLTQQLPEILREKLGGENAAAGGAIAATLGLVELVGPARLALTIAVAPKVSETVRQWEWFRNIEKPIVEIASSLASRFATKAS